MIVERVGQIIKPTDIPEDDGKNINGPTCIKVPNWCSNKLANYYLYFAHHSGKYIRMCYSDSLDFGWTNYVGGVINLDSFYDANDHIASPEIYINHKSKLIYLYFHAPSRSKNQQWTYLAISKDGISFDKVFDYPLAPFYMRVFEYSGFIYGMVKGGGIWKSKDGIDKFVFVKNPFNPLLKDEIWHNDSGSIRHVGLCLINNLLHIFFSRIGDSPERILYTSINLKKNSEKDWIVTEFLEIIKPEEDYEGAQIPSQESKAGAADEAVNALRDPFIMNNSGNFYLFYSVAGEQGIALSRLRYLL
jgi:hypothetical protein